MSKHASNAQTTLVLNHLRSGKSINPLEALSEYGVYRLGAIIFTLKQEGHNISSQLVFFRKPSGTTGRYAVYRLEEGAV